MKRTLLTAGMILLATGAAAMAGLIDLTTAGAISDPVNGAYFEQTWFDPSTGTGVFDTFLRIQDNGEEEGYNTSGEPQLDTKSGQWTHAIQLGDVPVIGDFYAFSLDINETKTSDGRYLSLDALKIHIVSEDIGGALSDYGTNALFGLPAWELGEGNWIKLDYSLNGGSGNGDMAALIPISALGTDLDSYVYLYSKFGVNCASDAGFEEWGVIVPTNVSVPEPATLMLLALGSVFLFRRH